MNRPALVRPAVRAWWVAVALLVASAPAAAQLRAPTIELRVGLATGNYDPANAEPKASLNQPALAAEAQLPLVPGFSLYGGYSYARFGCSGGFCRNASIHFTSRGLDAGVQRGGPDGVWVRGGVVRHRLDVPLSPSGSPRVSSNVATGLQAGAGFGFGVRDRLVVSPGLRYTRYSASFRDVPGSDRVDFLVADVGVRLRW
jgi:opacity protein-like surface antigen